MKSFALLAAFLNLFLGKALAIETAAGAAALTGTAVVSQNYLVGYEWLQGATGSYYGPYADLIFKQKLYQDFTAELNARVSKGASSDDSAFLGLETASVSYVGPWVTFSGGRRDVGTFLSPGTFFGSYSTMGERQLDSAMVTLPFRFFAEIPDADAQVTAPYNALSVFYTPNLFEADQTTYAGDQGMVIGQLRVKFDFDKISFDVIANYGQGTGDYFQYGTVNPSGTAEGSIALKYGIYSIWADYAVQSMAFFQSTQVAAGGVGFNVKKWTFGLLDTLTGEVQMPLGIGDPNNPFTGGDPQAEGSDGVTPELAWFGQVRKEFGAKSPNEPMRFFYGVAATNSVGDYTLARISQGALSVPVGQGFGLGPKVEGLALRSSSYNTAAGIVYAGYEF